MSLPLREALRAPFDSARWRELLGEIFASVEFDLHPVAHLVPTDRIRACREFGRVKLADGRGLVLLEIEIGDTIDLLRNRVELRNLVARFIDQDRAHGVLAIIRSGQPEYRLTFASRVSEFDAAAEAFVQRETATRRFTYVLGPGQPCRTAATRLAGLAGRRDTAQLKDLIDAFSVDVLNKDFFRAFCGIFDLVVAEIRANHPWPKEVAEEEAQTLLDRLIFLYFIQRKGWLDRDRAFLSRHFHDDGHAAKPDATSYLDSFLRPVFKKLSTPGFAADMAGHDLPFLNGGLFADEAGAEQRDDAIRRRHTLRVRNHIFARVFDDLLDIYAFTIHEDSPLDHEVAVDPEMLGHIFESLILQLDQTGAGGQSSRGDTGSFYTPRPIVRYVCREALAEWLETLPIFAENRKTNIRPLLALDASDGLDERELATLRELLTPDDAEAILRALDSLRACDPAVGSGAFPIGLLHELVNLARLAETRARGKDPVETDSHWLFDTKTRFIERAIYGVDLQARAIEICKLRLWLSLVVDYPLDVDPADCSAKSFRDALRKLPALPNLDFKIRRANSLIDMIHGVPVNLGKLRENTASNPALNRLSSAKHDFFHAQSVAKKRDLQLAIFDALTELAEIALRDARNDLGLVPDERNAARVAELERARAAVGADRVLVKSALHSKARVADKEAVIEQLRARFDDPEKPTFVWQLDFAEVFHRPAVMRVGQSEPSMPGEPGFDIAVANPPYIPMESISETDRIAFQLRYVELTRKFDSAAVFILRTLEILQPCGCLAFISSVTWQTGENYAGLRKTIFTKATLQRLINLPFDIFAAAYVDTGIYTITRRESDHYYISILPKKAKIEDFNAVPFVKVPTSLVVPPSYKVVLNPQATIIYRRLAAKPNITTLGAVTNSTQGLAGNRFRRTDTPQTPTHMPFAANVTVARYTLEIAATETVEMADHPSLIAFYKADEKLLIRRIISRQDRLLAAMTSAAMVFKKDIQPFVITHEALSAKYLLALVNSSLLSWLYVQTSAIATKDDFRQTTLAELRSLPVRLIEHSDPDDKAAHDAIVARVDDILAAKRAGDEATVTALEAEIDTHVFRLYGLTDDERKLIEGHA